jgi:hypothetical protein
VKKRIPTPARNVTAVVRSAASHYTDSYSGSLLTHVTYIFTILVCHDKVFPLITLVYTNTDLNANNVSSDNSI